MENAQKNTGAAWEPIENVWKTFALRGNLWKTQRKHRCCEQPIENVRKTHAWSGNQ